jgi:hypothetical protein
MIRAFAYLIVHTTRNKWLSQLKRIRNPRYAIAVLLGIGYFVMLSFNMSRNGAAAPNPISTVTTSAFAVLLPMLLLVMAAYAWVFGTDGSALAFTQAEVAMLFTAPVSRRALIVYKLVRSQAAVLVTTVIWFVVFRRAGGIERVLSYWVGLSILNMHRLGIALIRASGAAHGIPGSRRNLPAVALFTTAFAVVATTFARSSGEILAAEGMSAKLAAVVAVATRAPVSWVLYPFHLAVAPGFAAHGLPWVKAMLAALAVLAAHALWVLWTDANFEEAAAEASARQAVRLATQRSRGVSTERIARAKRRTVPLSANGAPWVAIIWKNFLYLQRAGTLRAMIGFPFVLAAIALAFAGRSEIAVVLAMSTSFAIAATMTVFGPMSLRSDLRAELARLPILKTMPLGGRDIVLAEIASTALPTALMQILLVASGTLALFQLQRGGPPVAYVIGGVAGIPVLLVGLSMANFTIHNGMALLFPAWVKTGEAGTAGVETIGQGVLTVVITSFLLLVLALLPLAVGGGLFLYWRPLPTVAVAFSTGAAGLILGAESFGLMHLLGRSLERLEPAQVG